MSINIKVCVFFLYFIIFQDALCSTVLIHSVFCYEKKHQTFEIDEPEAVASSFAVIKEADEVNVDTNDSELIIFLFVVINRKPSIITYLFRLLKCSIRVESLLLQSPDSSSQEEAKWYDG